MTMKIQCDVCSKEEASVFCTADEAALCNSCDHRVHHANKLASKHQRFSLSSKDFPLCDICQEKRGLLFCQQDRAILCRDCDVPIHTATEHTKKHSRFLLTGTKVSASSSVYHPRAADSNMFDTVPDFRAEAQKTITAVASELQKPLSSSSTTDHHVVVGNSSISNSNSNMMMNPVQQAGNDKHNINNNNGSSSISDYMEMLPGWHFEDLLNNCSSPNSSFGFSKNDDYEGSMLPLVDTSDEYNDGMSLFSTSSSNLLGIWVPQAPTPPPLNHISGQNQINGGLLIKDQMKHSSNICMKKRWSDDEFYAVPQISPTCTAFKRSRLF